MEKYLKYRLRVDGYKIIAYDDLKKKAMTIMNLEVYRQAKPKHVKWCEYGIEVITEQGSFVIINENQINTTAISAGDFERFKYPKIFEKPNEKTPTMNNRHLIVSSLHCLCICCGKITTPDEISFDVEIFEPNTAVCNFCGFDYIIGLDHIPDYYEINTHINIFLGFIYSERYYLKNLANS